MRKKFLAMYALVGALVASPIFTSCIDSEESASVTQVRSERAAQIKAAAEMQKAMDELELQLKQVELEDDKLDLEKKKVEVERDILAAKYSILQNQANLDKYQDNVLSTLTSNYTQALTNIASYNQQIFNKTADIAQLERKHITAAAFIAKEKIAINNDIAALEAALELLKNTEATDKDDLTAQINELYAKLQAARDAKTNLEAQYGSTEIYQWNSNLTTYVTMDVKDDQGQQLYWQLDGSQGTTGTDTDDNGTPGDTSDDITINLPKVTAYVLDANGDKIVDSYGVDNAYRNNPTKLAAIEAARELHLLQINTQNFVDANNNPMNFFYEDANGYLTLSEAAVETFKQNHAVSAEEEIKNLKAALGTEADTETTVVEEGSTTLTLYAQLAAANKALADAEKALAENEDDNQTPTLEGNVNTAKLNVAIVKDQINSNLNNIAAWEKSKDFEDYLAAFNEGYADYKAAKDALVAADKEFTSLETEYNAINSLKNSLQGNGAEVLAEKIAEYEAKIVDAKQSLENLNRFVYVSDGHNTSSSTNYDYSKQEAAIAYAKEELEILKVKLASEEVIAAEAKAALDAYLATEEEA